MKLAAVITAAGLSSRMHEFKPMLMLGSDTMIGRLIKTFREAGVEEITVVSGYKSELLEKHLAGLGVKLCVNRDFATTKMFDSLCLGLKSLSRDADAVFVTPADIPLVKPETLKLMAGQGPALVRPVWGGESGHPVLIPARLVPQILSYGGSGGLQGALNALGEPFLDLPVEDEGVTLDADTPEDFRALRRREMESRNGGDLWLNLDISLGRSDVVLDHFRAQFLEMLAETGNIQSACACMHMSYTKGWTLLGNMEKELGYPLVERSAGGVKGGGTRLTEKGRHFLEAYAGFREELKAAAEELFEAYFPKELR